MKIFLHIGHHKTGTSHFQRVCAAFRTELAEAGIIYPHGLGHHDHQHGAVLKPITLGDPEHERVKYLHEWMESPSDRKILSAESLVSFTPGGGRALVEMLKTFGRVEIIYTIRRWEDYLPSRFAQGIARGDSWAWPDFLEACAKDFETCRNLNYEYILREYLSCEPDGFHLLQYDRASRQKAIFDITHVEETLKDLEAYQRLRQKDHNSRSPEIHSQAQRLCNLIDAEMTLASPDRFFKDRRKAASFSKAPIRVNRITSIAAQDLMRDDTFMGSLRHSSRRRSARKDLRPDFAAWAKSLNAFCSASGLPELSSDWFQSPEESFWAGDATTAEDLSVSMRQRIESELSQARHQA